MITPPRLPIVENKVGWEKRWQLTLIEPQLKPPEELDGIILPSPRLNVVVSVAPAKHVDASATAAEFLGTVGTQVPGLELEGGCVEISFHDGSHGVRQDLSFPTGGLKLRQAHLFRVDGDVASQIVVTSDADRSKPEFEAIVTDVLSFSTKSE